MRQYLATAITAARAAGGRQRQSYEQVHLIEFKGEIDLITEVDKACEEMVVSVIRSAYPDHDIGAEEGDYARRGSPFVWVIDPLDGTTNYAHGHPWFCVSIALEQHGEVILGVIYHPLADELYTAVKGEGAWLNGRPIGVSGRSPLRNCLLTTGFPYDRTRGNENNFAHFQNFQFAARAVRCNGSAALDLAGVATGRLDGYWECKLNPWDVAAGKLLVQEAGGRVTGYEGEPFDIRNHRIVASNGLIHDEILAVLRKDEG